MASRGVVVAGLGLLLCLAGFAFAEDAVAELEALSRGSKDRVLRLNDDTYRSFAKNPGSSRKYGILIFFDASMLRDNAQLGLPAFRAAFGAVAKQMSQGRDAKGKDAPYPPIFFAEIEFKQSEATFRSEGVNALPHVKYFGPGDDSKGSTVDWTRFPKSWEGLSKFLKDVCHVDTSDLKPPPPLSQTQMILLGTLAVIMIPIALRTFLTRRTFIHDPRVWCTSGLAIYLFSVSGGMFNIIRHMPWAVPDREKPGHWNYFLKQQGMQFGAEGMVVGSLYTTVGILLAFMVYALPYAKSSTMKRVGGIVCLLVSFFCVRQVLNIYIWKQGYWIHGFWPSSWR